MNAIDFKEADNGAVRSLGECYTPSHSYEGISTSAFRLDATEMEEVQETGLIWVYVSHGDFEPQGVVPFCSRPGGFDYISTAPRTFQNLLNDAVASRTAISTETGFEGLDPLKAMVNKIGACKGEETKEEFADYLNLLLVSFAKKFPTLKAKDLIELSYNRL